MWPGQQMQQRARPAWPQGWHSASQQQQRQQRIPYAQSQYRQANIDTHTLENREVVANEGCTGRADIFVVMDSSGSIRQNNYRKQLDFVARISEYFQLSPTDARIGAMIYSGDPQLLFRLNQYTNHQGVSQVKLE